MPTMMPPMNPFTLIIFIVAAFIWVLYKNINKVEPTMNMVRSSFMIIYCRNCGSKLDENDEICTQCGVRPLSEKNFCQECGVETKRNQEICIKCRSKLKSGDFSRLDQYYQREFTKILESDKKYTGKWNWAAFFFHIVWAMTKGLWATAFLGFLVPTATFICLVTLDITDSVYSFSIGGLVFCIVMGARGNYIYYNHYTKHN